MLKVGYINFWSDDLDTHILESYVYPLKNAGIDIDSKLYNPLETEVDICIHSVFRNPLNIFDVKGNPVFLCYSGENRLYPYKHPDGYSISFYEDDETNIYYPIWQDCYSNLKYRLDIEDLRNKTEFCSFIVSNGGSWWRNLVFESISKRYKKIDSCGTSMNNMKDGFILPRGWESAVDFHKRYKFNLCFENSKSENGNVHYITEKLVNAYVYGCVPIYWGDNSVTRWFNPKSFINCNNKSVDEIIKEIEFVDKHDDVYFDMLSQPLFNENIGWDGYIRNRYVEFMKKILKKEGKI